MTATPQDNFTMVSTGEKEQCLGELFRGWGRLYENYVIEKQEIIRQQLDKSKANATNFINSVIEQGKKVQTDLSFLRQKKITLEEQVKVLTEGNEKGHKQNSSLQNKVKELEQQKRTLQNQKSDLQREYDSLQSIQTAAQQKTEDLEKIVTDLKDKVKEGEQRLSITEGELKKFRKSNADLSIILTSFFDGPVEPLQSSTHSLNPEGHVIPQSSGSTPVGDCTDLRPANLVVNSGRSTDQEVQCEEAPNEEAKNYVAKSKPSQNANENKRKAKNGAGPLSKKIKTVANSQPSESNGHLQPVVNETKVETDDVKVVFHRKPSEATSAQWYQWSAPGITQLDFC